MTTPLATIFQGDVTLEQGSDVTQFGYGDLTVHRRAVIGSTEDSTGIVSQGSLLVSGGARIDKSLHVHSDFNVLYGITKLTETYIDTTNGPTTITGGNKVDISVGAASQFVSTSGNLSLISSTQSLRLFGGLNGPLAVDLQATDSAGGVRLLSGNVSGQVSLVSGSGGIVGVTSSGNVSLTANSGNAGLYVNSTTDNQNLILSLNGSTDSKVLIESSGVNTTTTALVLNTVNTAGNIVISNANGLGNGSLSQLVGSGGFVMLTNSGGSIDITSQGASSNYTVLSSGINQNLSINLQGQSDSTLLIQSSGTNVTNTALSIRCTNTNGNIHIAQPESSVGEVVVYTGTGGFNVSTQTGGSIAMTTYGASSTYTNATTLDNQNLTVSVSGNTNSKVIISSSGTGSEAIRLETTNGTGGISIASVGGIQIQTSDNNSRIEIGTSTPSVPVTIGTPSSAVTILGDLYVRGNTSSVDQQVVTIDDNIIVLNNAPYGTSDGGVAVKRFQAANDFGVGDVVMDTPDETGTVQNGSNNSTNVHLGLGASNLNDHYNGWWIKLTNGTGAGQVRHIKDYDGASKLATIYSTSDQANILGNPQPVQGMDFITIPDSTSTYSLFPCHYVMNIWDESNNEFAMVCSSTNPSDQDNPSFEPIISHYSNLHVNDLQSNAVFANTINDSLADITSTVFLTDNNTTPVSITGLPNNYGIYQIFVKPLVSTTRAHAIFIIGRVNVSTTPGNVTRIMSVKGAQNEQLDVQWRANEAPELSYRPFPGGGSSTAYKVKIVSL
jgi:hypothetical protein